MIRVALVASAVVLAAPATVAQTGIAVCDTYFAKWDDCHERMPEIHQEDFVTINGKMQQFIMGQVRTGGPKERKDAEQFCRQTAQNLRKSRMFYEYGCRF
jgi:hypothetical protein